MPAPSSFLNYGTVATDTGKDALPGLLDALSVIGDPRSAKGRRYPLTALLALCVCAMSAAAHNTPTAAIEWAQRADEWVLLRLGFPYDLVSEGVRIPDERTLRNVLARLDPADLARVGAVHADAIAAVESGPDRPLTPDGVSEREQRKAVRRADAPERTTPPRIQALAADGKTMRGSRRKDGTRSGVFHLARHSDATVVAATAIGAKHTETAAFITALDTLDDDQVRGRLITADALHTVQGHAHYLRGRGAHYLFYVKSNRKKLHERLKGLPWSQAPVLFDSKTEHSRNRIERRRLKVLATDGLNIAFPHAAQILRIERRRRFKGKESKVEQAVFAITDLPAHRARPDELAACLRRHWSIENAVHHVRDVTFGEDARRSRTTALPVVWGCLADFARQALTAAGWANKASGRRAHTDPDKALQLHRIPPINRPLLV